MSSGRARRSAGAVTAGALLAASFLLPPPRPLPFDLCPLHRMTGIPCLTCGLTRAACLFAHGDWFASLCMHPAGWLTFVVLAAASLWLVAEAAVDRNLAVQVRGRLFSLAVWLGATLSGLAWVARLAGFWPRA